MFSAQVCCHLLCFAVCPIIHLNGTHPSPPITDRDQEVDIKLPSLVRLCDAGCPIAIDNGAWSSVCGVDASFGQLFCTPVLPSALNCSEGQEGLLVAQSKSLLPGSLYTIHLGLCAHVHHRVPISSS
ncbi:hypothetical protein BJ138DRAFT_279734 [Hygrophoropsis aurantiaca]|uniref:Uncharacterized protein n=1 Tax=Hygrophoropsis aurantiaca TaxID=72124 RepID=A0ACB8A661_9AGAM|nr:hypothetical protein BJ138DRAFT_279734 [Hygrophoropsis aurantiaca]